MQTYLVYCGALIASLLFAYLGEITKKKKYAFCIVIVLSLVAGLRNETVGLDTPGYVMAIENIINGNLELAYGLEWTFRILCYVMSFVFKNPQWFLLIFALITNSLIILRLWDIKEQISFTWAIFAYYSMFFMMSLNLMRQFIAIAIVFYATKYLLKEKTITFILFVLLASVFHISAMVSIVYVFINITNWRYLSKRHKYFLIVTGFLSPLIFVYAYSNLVKYSSYFDDMSVDIGVFIFVKFAMLVISMFLVYKTTSEEYKEETDKTHRLAICAYIIGLLLTSLGYAWRFVDRIGLFFYIFEAVYIGYVFKQKNTRINLIIKIIYLLIFSYLLIGSIRGHGQGQNPYLFYWQS